MAAQENGSEQQLEPDKMSSFSLAFQHFSRKHYVNLSDALEEHDGKVSIGGRSNTNL